MNQNSRQKAKNSVEKDFYKLLNDSNSRDDCQNNINNCLFKPINNEQEEISYLKQHQRVLVKEMDEFIICDLTEQEIQNEFNCKLSRLKFEEHRDF